MSENSYLNCELEYHSTEIKEVHFNSQLKYLEKEKKFFKIDFFFSFFSFRSCKKIGVYIKLWPQLVLSCEVCPCENKCKALMLGGVSTAVSCSGLFLQLHLHKTLSAAFL